MLVLTSFLLQSIAAFGVFIIGRWTLSPDEYEVLSLTLAFAQFVSILSFEWVRLAAIRNLKFNFSHIDMNVLVSCLAIGCLICLIISTCLAVFTQFQANMYAVAACALFTGISDNIMNVFRISGSYTRFSLLQSARAFSTFTLASLTSYLTNNVSLTLLSFAIGHAAICVLALHAAKLERRCWTVPLSGVIRYVKFGVPMMAASVILLLSLLVVRSHLEISGDGADAMFAIDLLQKPFLLCLAVVQTLLMAGATRAFDDEGASNFASLWFFVTAEVLCVLSILAAFWVIANLSALYELNLHLPFLQLVPIVSVIFAVRVLSSDVVPFASQLLRQTSGAVLVAALDLSLVLIFIWLREVSVSSIIESFLIASVISFLASLLVHYSNWRRVLRQIRT